jgi:hypothetical protein
MREIIDLVEKVESRNFSNAFWSWFRASKIVDARGQPLIVYHGTGASIEAFRGMVWASVTPKLANDYAAFRGQMDQHPNVIPMYMRIERPFDADLGLSRTIKIGEFFNTVIEQAVDHGFQITDVNRITIQGLIDTVRQAAARAEAGPHFSRHEFWNDIHVMFEEDGAAAILQIFKVLGFDGIQMIENGELTFGAFRSEQVKSIYNRGNFDPNNEKISERFSIS